MVRVTPLLLALAAGQGAQAQLNTAAKAAGLLYFGTATDNSELSDTTYVQELDNTQDFGQITPANSMKVDISGHPFHTVIPGPFN
jgi:endo-1,4-beta-xylanase